MSPAFGQNWDLKLLEATQQNDISEVRKAIKSGADVNAADENGASSLMWAVYKADLPIVKLLIENGADEKKKGVIFIDTLRQSYYGNLTGIAAGEGDIEKIRYLIEEVGVLVSDREFNPETQKVDGWTAIQWAWKKQNRTIVEYLQSNGADITLDFEIRAEEIKRELGEESPEHITALYDFIYMVHYEEKDAERAKPLYFKLLTLTKKTAGLNTRIYAEYLMNLGLLYKDQDSCHKAIPIIEESTRIIRLVVGEAYSGLPQMLNLSALCYMNLGRPDSAIQLLTEAIDLQQKSVGRNHVNYYTTLSNLGAAYQDAAKFDKAVEIYKEIADLVLANDGEQHPSYTAVLNRLAVMYENMNNYNDAEKIHLEVLRVREKHLGNENPEVAVTLHNLSAVYKGLGNFNRAEAMGLRSLTIFQNTLGEEHEDYLTALGALGNLYSDFGEYDKAEEIFIRVKDNQKKLLGTSHPDYAIALNNLGLFYKNVGRLIEAESFLSKSVEIESSFYGPEHPELIVNLTNLAMVYGDLGNYNRSEELYRRALDIALYHYGENHMSVANIKNGLGIVKVELGEYGEAEFLLLESLKTMESIIGADNPTLASSLNNLAAFYGSIRNFEKGLTYIDRALEILINSVGEGHPNYIKMLNNRGTTEVWAGYVESGKKSISRSYELCVAHLSSGHPQRIMANTGMANMYLISGDYHLADSLYQSTLVLLRNTRGTDNIYYAATLHELGLLQYHAGDTEKSIATLKDALQAYSETVGEAHQFYVMVLNELAIKSRVFGDLLATSSYYQKVQIKQIDNIAANFSFMSDLEKAEYVHSTGRDLNIMRSFRFNYSSISPIEAQRAYDVELVSKGLILNSNIDVRNSITLSSDSNALKMYDRWLMIKNYLFDTQENSNQPSTQSYVGIGVGVDFQNDTLIFLTVMNGGPAENAGIRINDRVVRIDGVNVVGFDTNQIRNLIKGRDGSVVRLEVQREGTRGTITISVERQFIDTRSERVKLVEEAEDLEKKLTRNSLIFDKGQQLGNINSKDIQSTLQDGEVAIEFSSFPYYDDNVTWTDSVLYVALVLRKDYEYPIMVKLCEEKQIDSLFQHNDSSDRDVIANLYRGAVAVGETNAVSYGKRLYELLWKPLDSLLNEGDRVYFAPSGLMHRIAIAAIPYNDKGTLLSDRYQLTQLSTTAKLLDADESHTKPKEIVLFGGIEYEWKELANVDSELDKMSKNFVSRALPADLDRGNTSWSYLPGTLTETESIATLAAGAGVKVKKYSSTDATEERMKSLGGKNSPTIIHIATHGFFSPDPEKDRNENRMLQMMGDREQVYRYSDDPLNRAGLLFAGANSTWKGQETPTDREDGILTANEATYISLNNTELVVLSACETGLGEIKGSEGVFGLQRAFKSAGAKYVMMSLWKVPDLETSEFMTEFYSSYLNGTSIPDSYHKAQKVMRNKYPQDPYKWAAFVLMR